ncbi:MAG TPA: quinone-dependent dihydroorotate dehydrogenase [Chthoniobacterales bacterium]
MDWYRHVFRPLAFRLEPERAHDVTLLGLALASRFPAVLSPISGPTIAKPRTVFGLRFPNPVGLAAGMDKNAVAVPAWAAMGFGFVEVGTVTAQGQNGNPKPRLFRYPEQEALVNRMGFNNRGAESVARHLRQAREQPSWPSVPLGINLGKTKAVALAEATEDYLASFRALQGVGDYFVLNVSSPNTPGLRRLQERPALDALFQAVQAANTSRRPMLVKVAPDLTFSQIDDVLALVEQHRLAGLVATNTTLDHESLPPAKREAGGLSGCPLGKRALEVLHHLRKQTTLPIIAVGGIMDGEGGRARLDAGADLIQLYTGFIYRGPALIAAIVNGLTASPPNRGTAVREGTP